VQDRPGTRSPRAPHDAGKRLDEVRAAKQPIVRWQPRPRPPADREHPPGRVVEFGSSRPKGTPRETDPARLHARLLAAAPRRSWTGPATLGRWKPGSFVQFTVLTQAGERKQESAITMTLESVTEQGYSLKNTFTFGTSSRDQNENETSRRRRARKRSRSTEELRLHHLEVDREEGRGEERDADLARRRTGLPLKIAEDRGEEETVFTAVKVGEEISSPGRRSTASASKERRPPGRREQGGRLVLLQGPRRRGADDDRHEDRCRPASMTMEAVRFEAK